MNRSDKSTFLNKTTSFLIHSKKLQNKKINCWSKYLLCCSSKNKHSLCSNSTITSHQISVILQKATQFLLWSFLLCKFCKLNVLKMKQTWKIKKILSFSSVPSRTRRNKKTVGTTILFSLFTTFT